MDDDADLIARLSMRAGTIMEDVSPAAITLAQAQGLRRTDALIAVAHATHLINALVSAALALDQNANRQSRPNGDNRAETA